MNLFGRKFWQFQDTRRRTRVKANENKRTFILLTDWCPCSLWRSLRWFLQNIHACQTLHSVEEIQEWGRYMKRAERDINPAIRRESAPLHREEEEEEEHCQSPTKRPPLMVVLLVLLFSGQSKPLWPFVLYVLIYEISSKDQSHCIISLVFSMK